MSRILAAGLIALFVNACIIVDDGSSTLSVVNQSSYRLYDIRVAPVGSTTWSDNLLGGDVLLPGEELRISLACDTYDVLVVDELNTECVLSGVDVCFNSDAWVVTDIDLDTCAFNP
jgi:hypothetical protein